MKDFKRITKIASMKTHNDGTVSVFVEIGYKNGNLSISGVEGPTRNNCYGACGQIDMHEWSDYIDPLVDLEKLRQIWNDWHLNDMSTECEHQAALGWREAAKKKVTMLTYEKTTEAYTAGRKIEEQAMERLKAGECVQLDAEQIRVLSIPWSLKIPEGWPEPGPEFKLKSSEVKGLGGLYPSEHPEGLLGQPCPTCGHKYGSAWKKREVPEDVLQWLYNLPDDAASYPWKH